MLILCLMDAISKSLPRSSQPNLIQKAAMASIAHCKLTQRTISNDRSGKNGTHRFLPYINVQ